MKLDIKKGILKSASLDPDMELIVPEGVTEIKQVPFGVKKVVLPESLIKIGPYAFYFHALDEVTIPQSVAAIGSFAFDASSSLGQAQGSGDGLKRAYVYGTLGSSGNLGEGALGFHDNSNPCYCYIKGVPCTKLMKRLKDDGIIPITVDCEPGDISAPHRINAGRGFIHALDQGIPLEPTIEKSYRDFVGKHIDEYMELYKTDETVMNYITQTSRA